MEEALSFFWLIWFTRMELGGSNNGDEAPKFMWAPFG
jgi:hypothetical protein